VLYDPGNSEDETCLDIDFICDVSHQKSEGDAKLLTTAYPGDCFGELALLFRDNRRAASAAAKTFAELLRLQREEFNRVLQKHPTFAAQLQQQVELTYNKRRTSLSLPPVKLSSHRHM